MQKISGRYDKLFETHKKWFNAMYIILGSSSSHQNWRLIFNFYLSVYILNVHLVLLPETEQFPALLLSELECEVH